jgi:hypothetical protein
MVGEIIKCKAAYGKEKNQYSPFFLHLMGGNWVNAIFIKNKKLDREYFLDGAVCVVVWWCVS